MMSLNDSYSLRWITIPERCGHMVLSIDGERILLVIVRTIVGKEYLQVSGFYAGKEKFVGEKLDKLTLLVEPIPKESRLELARKIPEALPGDLKGSLLTFPINLE